MTLYYIPSKKLYLCLYLQICVCICVFDESDDIVASVTVHWFPLQHGVLVTHPWLQSAKYFYSTVFLLYDHLYFLQLHFYFMMICICCGCILISYSFFLIFAFFFWYLIFFSSDICCICVLYFSSRIEMWRNAGGAKILSSDKYKCSSVTNTGIPHWQIQCSPLTKYSNS